MKKCILQWKKVERFEWFEWFLTKKIHFQSQILTLFDDQSVDGFKKIGNYFWLQLIFGQKPCFLRPRQLARQAVNTH